MNDIIKEIIIYIKTCGKVFSRYDIQTYLLEKNMYIKSVEIDKIIVEFMDLDSVKYVSFNTYKYVGLK